MLDLLSNITPGDVKLGLGSIAIIGIGMHLLPRTRTMQIRRLERALTNRCKAIHEVEHRNAHINSHFKAMVKTQPLFQMFNANSIPIIWEMPEGAGSSTLMKWMVNDMHGIYINVHDAPIFSGTDLMFHIFKQSGLKFTSDTLTEFRIAERFFRRDLKFGTECFHAALTKISKRRLFFRKLEHRPLIIIDNFDKLEITLFNDSENSDIFWRFVHDLSSTKLAHVIFVANSGWHSKVLHDVVFDPVKDEDIYHSRSASILKTQDFNHISIKPPVTEYVQEFVRESEIPSMAHEKTVNMFGADINALQRIESAFSATKGILHDARHDFDGGINGTSTSNNVALMEELQPSSIDSSSSSSGSSRDTVMEASEEHLAKFLNDYVDSYQQLSWDKFDNFFKASLQEVDACPSSEKKLKLTKKLVRFWDLLELLVEQGGAVSKKELENTIFVGHPVDLHFFASQKLIFIGINCENNNTFHPTVSFMKRIDSFAVKQFMNEPRYALVLERLRYNNIESV
jgi:hypothetical protein